MYSNTHTANCSPSFSDDDILNKVKTVNKKVPVEKNKRK